MKVRFVSGLFRLWVVFSVFWLAGAGAYIVAGYQNVALRDLKRPVQNDDFIPAYEFCWDNYRTSGGKMDIFSDMPEQVAECERTADRWSVLKNGILIAFSIPIIALVLGWAFVWAFRGFLPAKNT
jgi:hypothetical protein